jgi:hypothetical protein
MADMSLTESPGTFGELSDVSEAAPGLSPLLRSTPLRYLRIEGTGLLFRPLLLDDDDEKSKLPEPDGLVSDPPTLISSLLGLSRVGMCSEGPSVPLKAIKSRSRSYPRHFRFDFMH